MEINKTIKCSICTKEIKSGFVYICAYCKDPYYICTLCFISPEFNHFVFEHNDPNGNLFIPSLLLKRNQLWKK